MSIASGYGPNWTTAESRGLDAQRRIAELEQQLAAAQAEVRELQRVQSDVLANLDAPDDMDVISAAHFVAGSLSTAEEALEAAQAEARELRAELARVRELCPEVIAFAHLMQHKLNMNAHKDGEGWGRDSSGKRGWKSCSPQFLMDKLHEEALELTSAIHAGDSAKSIRQEAADVGNIAMMLADVCGALSQPEQPAERLPLMAPATAARVLNDEAQRPLGRRYRVTDTDEHGLPVIERTADMPEGATHKITWLNDGMVDFTDSTPIALEANRSGGMSERIEDYRESGQEGKE